MFRIIQCDYYSFVCVNLTLLVLLTTVTNMPSVDAKFQVPSDAPDNFRFATSAFAERVYRSDWPRLETRDTRMPTRGFLYSAIGGRTLREASVSALSLKSVWPLANVTLVTNSNGLLWAKQHPNVAKVFDCIVNSQVKPERIFIFFFNFFF